MTVRLRGVTEKQRHETLDDALNALEPRLRAEATAQRPHGRRAFGHAYDPVSQVAARGELTGPGRLRAGIDVRGDGSAEAFTGRVVRRVVAQQPGEDAYRALRRVISG